MVDTENCINNEDRINIRHGKDEKSIVSGGAQGDDFGKVLGVFYLYRLLYSSRLLEVEGYNVDAKRV